MKKQMARLIRKLSQLAKVAAGIEISQRSRLRCEFLTLGTEDCKWRIRPDKLPKSPTVYSFGVGENISFDLEMMRIFGAEVHAFDPTPRAIRWVENVDTPTNFFLHSYAVGHVDGDIAFYPPECEEHVSHTAVDRINSGKNAIRVPMLRFATILDKLGHHSIDVLKMDIEGSEYDVIDDMLYSNTRPTQLLIEFHHRFPGIGIEQTKNAIKKLEKAGYSSFFVSRNAQEVSFCR